MCKCIPIDIINQIISELDGVALTKCSLLGPSWNESSKRNKTWKKICHLEIDSPTLKDILSKTSPDLKLISWQQLYRSWYLTINHPHHVWTWKENNVKSFGGNLEINRAVIIKGYVIVTVGGMILHRYCLATQKWSDPYQLAENYVSFKPLELEGQVYLVFHLCDDNFNFNLQMLKVEKEKISNHQSLELPQFEGDNIIIDLLGNNNLILIETFDTTKLYRLEHDTSDSNLVKLQFVKDIDFRFITWNDLLVRVTEDEVILYSIQGNSLSVKATIPITFIENESHNPTYIYYRTPRSLFLFIHNRYYEISETNGDYKINRYEESRYNNYFYGSLRFNPCFSNIFLTSVKSDSDIEDLNTIMFYKTSDIIEYLLEDHKGINSDIHDLCFHNDELVIIRTNRDKINIQRCKSNLVGTGKRFISLKNILKCFVIKFNLLNLILFPFF